MNSTKHFKKRKILITGGCGFIGVNLVSFLLKKRAGYIRIIDNLSTGSEKNLKDALMEIGDIITEKYNNRIIYKFKEVFKKYKYKNTNFVVELNKGDIQDYNNCLKATKDIDYVIHLAAHAGVIPSIENPFYDFEVNVKGTLNLLHSSVKNKVERFIFASSNAPLGEQSQPLNEEKVPKPLSPYGASKLACEGYCSAFFNSYGLKTISLRFSNVYGPYCLHKSSVIAKFIKDAITKRSITIYGDGNQTRDFLYVEDLCNAIYSVINLNSERLDIWGEVFHLGTGNETSITEIANHVNRLFNNKIEIIFAPKRRGEIKRNYSNIMKAKSLFGYNPEINIENKIKKVYKWFMNRIEKNKFRTHDIKP